LDLRAETEWRREEISLVVVIFMYFSLGLVL